MIKKFDISTALLLVDTQKGVNDIFIMEAKAGRNNPDAEKNILSLLSEWRKSHRRIAFTRHNSREQNSP